MALFELCGWDNKLCRTSRCANTGFAGYLCLLGKAPYINQTVPRVCSLALYLLQMRAISRKLSCRGMISTQSALRYTDI